MFASASLQEERSCVARSSEVPPSHFAKFGCLCGFMLHNRTSSIIIQSFPIHPIPSCSPPNSDSFSLDSEPDHSKDRTKVPRETGVGWKQHAEPTETGVNWEAAFLWEIYFHSKC